MYAIAVSIALALYTVILIDFGLVFHEISVNADMVTTSQALYAAEGAAEYALWATGSSSAGDRASRNTKFLKEQQDGDAGQTAFLEFNEDAQSSYLARNLTLNHSDLQISDAYSILNRAVRSRAYLTEEEALDPSSYYGFESVKAGGFIFREVTAETNFNELNFDYRFKEGSPEGGLLFEIFIFPREGKALDFSDFKGLRDFPDDNPIKRVVINTLDIPSNSYDTFTVRTPNPISGGYSKGLNISGFDPYAKNYILHFQTLNNQPITYRLSAKNNGGPVALPNLLQTVDVIGTTSTGLYQRVKIQRQSEENVQPGLNFVLFGDADINK